MENGKVVKGLFWRFLERFGAQGVSFVVSIILARLLDPTVYGTVAIVTVILSLLQVFIDSGMGNALIQKKDADELDYSSVFSFNIIFSLILYLVLFFLAPVIAEYYSVQVLVPVVRVLSLTLVFSGVKNVLQAYISKRLEFKKFFFATLWGTIGAAIIGITMAYLGFGVWALVAQYLFNGLVDTIVLWVSCKWHPKIGFDYYRFKKLFSFGWKILVSSLLDTFYTDATQLIVGKVYSPAELAYFNRGRTIPGLAVISINSSLDSVLLPTMSQAQDNAEELRKMTRQFISTGLYIMAPLLIGLAFVSDTLVRVLLTEKWLESVMYIQIYSIVYMFFPIHTANISAIKASGRADLVLKLELIKKIISFLILFATIFISVKAMAYGMLLVSIANQIINSWPNKRLLNYSYVDQLRDIIPSILLALLMGALIAPITLLRMPDIVTLLVQIFLGAAIYIGGSIVTHNGNYTIVLRSIKRLLHMKQ